MSAVIFALIVLAVAASGAMFSPGDWYLTLKKPTWTPPNWLFGPVWTTLYVMIAAAGWLVWRAPDNNKVVSVWGVNVALNALWSWLFFGQRWIELALVDIVFIWLTIIVFIVLAWPKNRLASLLFVPYLAWVSVATALNFTIWRMNG